MLGSFAFSIFYEFLTCFRRTRLSVAAWRSAHPCRWRGAVATLFALQLACGYTLMLVAMTYQVELFAATILGLGVGHFAFNTTAPVSASVDPCCDDGSFDASDCGGENKLRALTAPLLPPSAANGMEPTLSGAVTMAVEGMVCEHCTAAVDAALRAVAGVTDVSVDLAASQARVQGGAPVDDLVSAVNAAGYRATAQSPAQRIGGTREGYEAPSVPLSQADDDDVAMPRRMREAEKRKREAAAAAGGAPPSDGGSTTWLTVEGMVCNGCRSRVERALNGLGSVSSVFVDLHAALARVCHEPSLPLDQLIATVRQLGYRPTMSADEAVQAYEAAARTESQKSNPSDHQLMLEIDGMHCAACVAKVERSLSELGGVTHASVSLLGKSAKVLFEPRRIGVQDIFTAIDSLGYRAVPHSDGAETSALVTQGLADEARSWRACVLGSLSWTLPIMMLSMVLPMTPLAPLLMTPVVHGLSVRVALLWLLATVVQVTYGARFYRSAWTALRHCTTNMDTLVALGTSIAYGYSVLVVVCAWHQRSRPRSSAQLSLSASPDSPVADPCTPAGDQHRGRLEWAGR